MSQHPHDALFKLAFSETESATSLLREVLPAALSARLDWSSLRQEPGSFVNDALADRHADLLFSVRVDGRAAFLYVLLEHQSRPDPLMPFRMLVYVTRIWEAFLRNEPNAARLPAVLPVVVHHGEGGWTGPVELRELVDLDPAAAAAVAEFLPGFRFMLEDIARVDEPGLLKRRLTVRAVATLLFLRFVRAYGREEFLAATHRWGLVLQPLATAPGGPGVLWALMRYALSGQVELEDVLAVARRLGPAVEEAIMTGAEKLVKEGEARGEARGRVEVVLKLLRLRFGSVPHEAEQRIRAASIAELDVLAERVLTAQSLEEALP